MKKLIISLTLCLLSLSAAAECQRSELPRAFYGDLHVHTGLSNDAFGMGTRAGPDAAYRYAKGETISVSPTLELTPPTQLDFAAVTDHAEQMAAATICAQADHPNYNSWACRIERRLPRAGILLNQIASHWFGDDLGACADGACARAYSGAWQQTVAAAEQHNQPCEFTSFVGYEWSGRVDNGPTIHRNVIFNQDPQIALPFDAFSYPEPEQLWQQLRQHCADQSNGCDAVTIPHNSNLSEGRMFSALTPDGGLTPEQVAERARFDRLAEIIQHKGASECYYQPGDSDEACQFELLPYDSFIGKMAPPLAKPPKNDSSFLRNALKEGLRYQQRDGVNPFATGFIGSTDTHIVSPGQVSEAGYREHHNKEQPSPALGQMLPKPTELNPGGLAVLYARENSREALFDAIKRREAYATSGHRVAVRFFAGEDLPADLCERQDALQQAYARGTPMGGEIRGGDSPRFFLSALKAADSPAQAMPGLRKLQVIKGWLDDKGNSHEKVFDLASSPALSSDFASCREVEARSASLCASWQDPLFDPQQQAFYYARVLEQPSCRWDQYYCEAVVDRCPELDSEDPAHQLCCQSAPKRIQERAWTSPIWYSPAAGQ